MARRSVPPPKPKSPILTVGQKRRRIERLQKCITSLEAFDPRMARKRAPAVLALETAIDKALSSAFGYGTSAYLRYNQAAILDPSPLLTNATLRSPVLRPVGGPPVGGPGRHDAKAHETRQHFLENKERSIALLREAICALEDDIADAEPLVMATSVPKVAQKTEEVRTLHPTRRDRVGLADRVRLWWRGRGN
jgi:hypothetical protein